MKTTKETKALASQASDLEQKNDKPKKQKLKEKIIQVNQQSFDQKDLEKMLESEASLKSGDNSMSLTTLTPSL